MANGYKEILNPISNSFKGCLPTKKVLLIILLQQKHNKGSKKQHKKMCLKNP